MANFRIGADINAQRLQLQGEVERRKQLAKEAEDRLSSLRAERATLPSYPEPFEVVAEERTGATVLKELARQHEALSEQIAQAEKQAEFTRRQLGSVSQSLQWLGYIPEGTAAEERELQTGKKALIAEAQKRQEETGKSIATELGNIALERVQTAGGGKSYQEMTPQQQETYIEQRKQDLTPEQAAGVATLPDRSQQELYKIARNERLSHSEAIELVHKTNALTDLELRQIEATINQGLPILEAVREATQYVDVELSDGSKIKVSGAELNKLQSLEGDKQARYARSLGLVKEVEREEVTETIIEAPIADDFEAKHTQMKDGVWLTNESLGRLRDNQPGAYDILLSEGYGKYQSMLKEAQEYVDKNYRIPYKQGYTYRLAGAVGREGLVRGVDTTDSQEFKYLQLMFSEKSIKPIRDTLMSPIPPKYPELSKLQKVVPIIPVLAIGAPIAVAEPTPFGEILLAATAAGMVAYAGYKLKDIDYAALGQDIRQYVSDFRAKYGREPQVSEVDVNIEGQVVPLATLIPLIPVPHKPVEENLIPPAVKPVEEQIVVPTVKPVEEQIVVPEMAPVQEQIVVPTVEPVTEALIPPTVSPLSMTQAAAALKEAEDILNGTEIRPSILGDEWVTYIPQTTATDTARSLIALDNAVIIAYQSGELDEEGYRAYQAARRNYLIKKMAYDDAMTQYIGGMNPQVESSELDIIANIIPATIRKPKTITRVGTALFQAVQVASSLDTKTQMKTAAKEIIQTRLRNLVKNQVITKAQARTLTAALAKVAVNTATQTATQTPTTPATAQEAVQEFTDTITDTTTTTTTGGFRLPKGSPIGDDKSRREFLKVVSGLVAYRRGSLKGKGDMWLVSFYPYGDKDKTVLFGAPPEGAKYATGKGSVNKTATVIRGIPPDRPLFRDTGAVDDIVMPSGKGIVVKSVKDKAVKRKRGRPKKEKKSPYRISDAGQEEVKKKRGRPPKLATIKTLDVGAGIEVNVKGRGHIKV